MVGQRCLFISGCGAVDSALGLGPRGRRFESFHPDHIVFLLKSTIISYGGFSFITEIGLSRARRLDTTSRYLASSSIKSDVSSIVLRYEWTSSTNSPRVGNAFCKSSNSFCDAVMVALTALI